MAIIDMKRGNKNIVKAYKNNVVIYEKGDYYIQSAINIGDTTNTVGYIPVLDKELYSNFRYEVDGEFDYTAPRLYSILGGIFEGGYDWLRPCLIFCLFNFSFDNIDYGIGLFDKNLLFYNYELYAMPNCYEDYTQYRSQRHIYSFSNPNYEPFSPMPNNTYKRTNGGFFLLNCRDINGSQVVGDYNRPDGLYNENGKIYRISIYDTNNNLLMNFKPKIQNGHKGMIDTVSGTFYPCNDDTKFIIDKEA